VDPYDLARIILRFWGDTRDARIALAIAWAESGLNERAAGDHLSWLDPAIAERFRGSDCLGYTSWGLFQINVPSWRPLLAYIVGVDDACRIADWLLHPENNVRAAYAIYRTLKDRGADPWWPWSVYKFRTYERYWPDAVGVFNAILASPPPAELAPEEPDPIDFANTTPFPDRIAEIGRDTGIYAWFFENFNPEDVGV
jgi:hypothetical protein